MALGQYKTAKKTFLNSGKSLSRKCRILQYRDLSAQRLHYEAEHVNYCGLVIG